MEGLKLPVLDYKRLKEILNATRAYSALGRTGSWLCGWNAQGDHTPKFMELERILLDESRHLIVDADNSWFVADDDLISSRAKDVQGKTLSQRKAGNEGHTADVLADTQTRIVIASKLRIRGAKLKESVEYLFNLVTDHHTCSLRGCGVIQDRVYGSPEIVMKTVQTGLGCAFIMPQHLMNYHPYCTETQLQASKAGAVFNQARMAQGNGDNVVPAEQDSGSESDSDEESAHDPVFNAESQFESEIRGDSENWVMPDAPLLGPDIWAACKNVKVTGQSNAAPMRVFAIVVRERGDQKACKALRFYFAWPGIQSFLHKWMAGFHPVSKFNARNMLYFPDISDPQASSRLAIERAVTGRFVPLTAGQLCAD